MKSLFTRFIQNILAQNYLKVAVYAKDTGSQQPWDNKIMEFGRIPAVGELVRVEGRSVALEVTDVVHEFNRLPGTCANVFLKA